MSKASARQGPAAEVGVDTAAGAVAVDAFGLRIRSEVPCIGIPPVRDDTLPDVQVRIGATPARLVDATVSNERFDASPGRLLLKSRTIADFLVEDGRHITVAPKPEANPAALCNLLFGWAIGGLLLQRGTLALHAAAVANEHGAVAFSGASGVGKSTLVCLLAERGWRLMDDNIAALRMSAGCSIAVHPGLGSVRLMPNTLEFLERSDADLGALDPLRSKFIVPVPAVQLVRQPAPLKRIFVLSRGEGPGRVPMQSQARFEAVRGNSFMSRFASGLGVLDQLFARWLRVAAEVPVDSLVVPMDRSAHAFADQVAAMLSTELGG